MALIDTSFVLGPCASSGSEQWGTNMTPLPWHQVARGKGKFTLQKAQAAHKVGLFPLTFIPTGTKFFPQNLMLLFGN
jgi:hypothetical protein